MSTATTRLGIRRSTPAPVFDRLRLLLAGGGNNSMVDDVADDVTDALLGFVYDPPAHGAAALEDFLAPLPGADLRAKRPRECVVDGEFSAAGARGAVVLTAPAPELVTRFVPTPPAPPTLLPVQQQQRLQLPDAAFVRGAGAAEAKKGATAGDDDDGRHHHHNQAVQSAAARERRRRISNKTAELSRLIPGAARMNSTAEMLQAAARHVRLLQAQVGMLALMHSSGEAKAPSMAASQEHQMRALLVSGGVQERLAGEGKCLVPTSLVHAIADDEAMANSNPALSRDLNRFKDSLEQQQ